VWDAFYVVAKRTSARVKVGVTSGDPRPRLAQHKSAGYTEVVRFGHVVGADVLEREVLAALAAAGVTSVRGREYFDLDLALDVILGVVNEWMASGRLAA
jgi:hypothetical protein